VPLLWTVTAPCPLRSFILELSSAREAAPEARWSQDRPSRSDLEMPLLLPLLWAGSLQDAPRYKVQVQESVMVQESLCVLVPCTISCVGAGWNDPTPAYGSWFQKSGYSSKDVLMVTNNPARKGKSKTRFPFRLSGDPWTNNCSLSIADAKKAGRVDTIIFNWREEGM
ncbi:hypothetical protein HPG69_014127, partial [Diceros bicornis minor]